VDGCGCVVDELPPKGSIHLGLYLYPEVDDDLCTLIEKAVENVVSESDAYVYAQCYFTYSKEGVGECVKDGPRVYKGNDVAMDIATDAVILIHKTLHKLENRSWRINTEDEHDKLLESSTVYIDIVRSTHAIEDYKIEGCPLESFVHNCIMSAKYVSGIDPGWSVHDKFLALRRLNIMPGSSALTFNGRRSGFKKVF
jgi:hypothetical protein